MTFAETYPHAYAELAELSGSAEFRDWAKENGESLLPFCREDTEHRRRVVLAIAYEYLSGSGA